MKKQNITKYFLLCYISSFALAKWWNLPISGFKFQLTEVLFLLGLGLIGLGKIPFRCRAFDRLDWGITALVILTALGALGGNFMGSRTGLLGLAYLYAAYLLFSRVEFKDIGETLKLVTAGWMGAAILVSLGGLIGILCWWMDIDTFLVHEKYLPYWGEGARAASFVRHPDVVANLVVYALIFYSCQHWKDLSLSTFRGTSGLILLFAIVLIFSFSKFLLLIPFTFLLVFMRLNRKRRGVLRQLVFALSGFSVLLFLLGTHYFLIAKADWQTDRSKMEAFITENIVWEGREVRIVETAYVPLKKLAQQAGLENWPFGIGMGQFPEYLNEQIFLGKAPDIPAYDVHSSYWGLWAESGLLGGIGGLFFLGCLFSYLRVWSRQVKSRPERVYWVVVTTMLLYVLVEGVVLDGLHFRHHWFLLVLVSWGFRPQGPGAFAQST